MVGLLAAVGAAMSALIGLIHVTAPNSLWLLTVEFSLVEGGAG
jgi:hypothetical protein